MFLIISICNIYCLYLVNRQMLFALFKKQHKLKEHKGGRVRSPMCSTQNYVEFTPKPWYML